MEGYTSPRNDYVFASGFVAEQVTPADATLGYSARVTIVLLILLQF
ncbi:hypothetical protein [Polymorphobacter megasporae]|nr:hypothetical protein [Polymorphobacter megasporae]UAJ09719.1 hypothetical protein KTC28_15680 [Polymorphobacter megasporae]